MVRGGRAPPRDWLWGRPLVAIHRDRRLKMRVPVQTGLVLGEEGQGAGGHPGQGVVGAAGENDGDTGARGPGDRPN